MEERLEELNELVLEVQELLSSDLPYDEIQQSLEAYHDNDLADVLPLLSKKERFKLYEVVDIIRLAEIYSYIEDPSDLIYEMDQEQAADIIEEMDSDDAVDLLEELEDEQREELIELIDEEAKQDIEMITSYDEDEIGSMMTTNFILIDRHCTAREAMNALVQQAAENDNIQTIYVEDNQHFYGAIELKDLITTRSNDHDLDDIIMTGYPSVDAHEKIQDCLNYLSDYSEDSIPVLDENKHILGVITAQDLVEIVDDEMGEDYAKLAGLTEEEDLEETIFQSVIKRLPWLLLLLVLGLGVSSVVGMFEAVVSSLTIVMCFQSLILDMSGNVGTQSLAVTIRVLTDEEIDTKTIFKLIFKEVKVGLANGIILGSLSFIFIGLYIWLLKDSPLSFSYLVSGCVGLALTLAMLISSLTGTIIPIFFKKIGVDPAVASGPLITTINDLVAVISYYGLCWLLLIQLFHLG